MGLEFASETPLAIKRVSRRAKFNAPGRILAAGGVYDLRVRNLSRSGALAEMDLPPREGSEVVLLCAGLTLPANVAWVLGRRFGLEFQVVISEADVAACSGPRRLA